MPGNIMKLAASSTLALSLLAAPALAQEFGEWDGDGDGAISGEEFNTGFGENGAFGSWDANGDGGLDETELGTGFGDREVGEFSDWDGNADGRVNNEEFNAGVYNNYDADDSGAIEEPEFGDVGDDMGDGGLFDI
jgi:hypothetical protein